MSICPELNPNSLIRDRGVSSDPKQYPCLVQALRGADSTKRSNTEISNADLAVHSSPPLYRQYLYDLDGKNHFGLAVEQERLGKNAKSASPPSETHEHEEISRDMRRQDEGRRLSRSMRFALQSGARELLPEQKRLQGCLRWMSEGAGAVQVMYKPLTRSARLGGLQTCGSVWMCPVCAAKISEHRRVDLGEAVRTWWQRGGMILLVTYTIRHKVGDDLAALLTGLTAARRRVFAGAPGQRLRARGGVVGSIRALEVTHGENGYHPHVHELLFIQPGHTEIEGLFDGLRARWSAAIAAVGMRGVNHHAVDIKIAKEEIEQYITKQGVQSTWGVEHELTKSSTKMGKTKGKTPMQLLSEFTFEGSIEAGRLYAEYARVFKGRRQLYWSHGLRDLLNMGVEISDEEIVRDVEPVEELIYLIDRETWKQVIRLDAVSDLINVSSSGCGDCVHRFLNDLIPARTDAKQSDAQGLGRAERYLCPVEVCYYA